MITLLAKVTLLLVIGATLALVLRNRSAAARHFVWCVTLLGCLAVAGLAFVAPPLKVSIPAQAPMTAVAPIATDAGDPMERRALSLPDHRNQFGGLGALRSTGPVVWAIGFASVLAYLALGHLALARIARRATPAGNASGVPIRVTDRVSAPVTWGWRRPMILLPIEAAAWPEERRRAALLHELAHVARFDYLLQLLGSLVCAMYWFHPLAWYALRRLRAESEHACDDSVLARGMTAPEYAAHLLAVAHGALSRRHGALTAVAMARPSQLESRLVAVLDETRKRGSISRRVASAAAIAAVAVLLPLAAARPELRAATVELIKSKKNVDAPQPRVDHSIPASPGETLHLDLQTGATVTVSGWDEPRIAVESDLRGRDVANVRVDVARANDGVRIATIFQGDNRNGYSTSIGFKVRVPRRFNVLVDSAGGGVTLLDLDGRFRGTTGGGAIVIERASGTANLITGGGAIDVRDSNLEGSVSTGGGPVTLTRVRGGLRGNSGSGPVVRTSKDDMFTMNLAGGDIEIGRTDEDVDASTGGGDVRIGPVAGSVRASTGGGDVEITVTEADASVEATTGSGRITVTLPASYDGSFELESAYTNNLGRKTRIDSDWDLEQSETQRWDPDEGTPRRYVRARGKAGAGRGVVRVKAINGDVVIRRR